MPGPIALQDEYSLVARRIELEHIPAGRDCGLGIVPWSPLAAGFLAGKYQRGDNGAAGEGRLSGPNPFGDSKFTDENWRVLDTLRTVASDVGCPPAQVALAWALAQVGVASLLLGASKPEQLHDNVASLEVALSPEQLRTLDESSALNPNISYAAISQIIFEGKRVQGWH